MKTTVAINRTDFFHWGQAVDIDTARHTKIVGTTGAGKSTVLLEIILSEIEAGHGVTVMEPHGQLIDDILAALPPNRRNDVIYFDPGDSAFLPAVNILEGDDKLKKIQEAAKIVSSVWPDAWGPQTDYIFRNFGEAVIEAEAHPTLLHIYRAYMDKEYRVFLRDRITSPTLRLFFEKYEDDWDKRQQEAASAPGTNKVDTFMQRPLRHVVSGRSGLNFRRILDDSQILLCRFSKGKIGPTAGAFLGSVVIAKILFAALERENTSHRPPHRVFIDEAGSFLCGTAHEQLLTETRKYGVSLTMGFQHEAQLDAKLRSAVLGNIGTLMVGRVNSEDAELLAAELGLPDGLTLQKLPNFAWYLRTVQNGTPSDPIRADGLPPRPRTQDKEVVPRIIERSRTRYGTPITTIEEHIAAFLGGPHEARKRRQGERGKKAVGRRNPGGNQRPARHARNDRRAVG